MFMVCLQKDTPVTALKTELKLICQGENPSQGRSYKGVDKS